MLLTISLSKTVETVLEGEVLLTQLKQKIASVPDVIIAAQCIAVLEPPEE